MGVLVAQSRINGRRHVLRAFSGQFTERWHCNGWAGPVAGITSRSPEYQQARWGQRTCQHAILGNMMVIHMNRPLPIIIGSSL